MSASLGNLVEGRGRRMVMLLLPAILFPLAVAGVTVKPALDLQRAKGKVADAEVRAQMVAGLRQQADSLGPVSDILAQAGAVDQALRTMLPEELGSLQVYSLLRSTAQSAGLVLASLQVDDPVVFRSALDGKSIGQRTIRLKGTCDFEGTSSFIDRLRVAGLPTAVQAYTFVARASGATYDVDLRLDVFHLIPPAAPAAGESPESEGEPAPQ